MTNLSLRERFARLGLTQEIDRNQEGSPFVVDLRPASDSSRVLTVTATLALAKRGATMLRAKRAIEEMLDSGRAVLQLPLVEDVGALARDLAENGCAVALIASGEIDVRALRESLGLTQEQFALRYGFDPVAVRNWEQHRRRPEAAAASYLRVIARMPEAASAALEEPIA